MEIIDQMNRERVLYLFLKSSMFDCLLRFCVFLGVFWGGIRYTLHVFPGDDDEIIKIL